MTISGPLYRNSSPSPADGRGDRPVRTFSDGDRGAGPRLQEVGG